MPEKLPNRHRYRADWHDYNGGIYFITVCTHLRRHTLGHIVGSEMYQSDCGDILESVIADASLHHKNVSIPSFVIMPNHFHMIVMIDNQDMTDCVARKFGGVPTLLASLIGGIKSSVTRISRQRGIDFAWQRGYHDHIVRDNHELNTINDYINNNVIRWATDCYNK